MSALYSKLSICVQVFFIALMSLLFYKWMAKRYRSGMTSLCSILHIMTIPQFSNGNSFWPVARWTKFRPVAWKWRILCFSYGCYSLCLVSIAVFTENRTNQQDNDNAHNAKKLQTRCRKPTLQLVFISH